MFCATGCNPSSVFGVNLSRSVGNQLTRLVVVAHELAITLS